MPWIGSWNIIKLVPALLAADFLVDLANHREYEHRCKQLEVGIQPEERGNYKRSTVFYFASHVLANVYVVILECGRLWGHISRLELLEGLCQRFDWHCGRLPMAPMNFRKREASKFALFTCIFIFELVSPRTIGSMLSCAGAAAAQKLAASVDLVGLKES